MLHYLYISKEFEKKNVSKANLPLCWTIKRSGGVIGSMQSRFKLTVHWPLMEALPLQSTNHGIKMFILTSLVHGVYPKRELDRLCAFLSQNKFDAVNSQYINFI